MTRISVNEIATRAAVRPDWQRSLSILTFTVVSVVAITILYWGQAIFIPVALGAFLTFLLSPLVSALRQAASGGCQPFSDGVFGGIVLGHGGVGGHSSDFQPAPGITPV